MKQFKRFISVLLSALMTAAVLTALPFAASAASDIYVITGDSVWLDGWNPQPTENVMTSPSKTCFPMMRTTSFRSSALSAATRTARSGTARTAPPITMISG